MSVDLSAQKAVHRAARLASHITVTANAVAGQQAEAKLPAYSAAADNKYAHVPMAPLDPILGTKILHDADPSPDKINLGIGAYRTNDGKPYVLPVVRKAEQLIAADQTLNHEYLPQTGDAKFKPLAAALLFGKNSPLLAQGKVATTQTISGTGGLRVAAAFVQRFLPKATVYCSKPTWGNHISILQDAGVPVGYYTYWDEKSRGLNLDGMLADLQKASAGSVVMLHACAHNPTGVDPTQAQWKKIADVMEAKKLIPWFDSAYQGFASGDLERDAWAIRYFAERGFQLMVCQSFAKNFGLYNERVGTFNVVCSSKEEAERVASQLALLIRPMYSNPPVQGARIVTTVLSNNALYTEWLGELKIMSGRIKQTRDMLVAELKKLGTPGDWSHITSQIGMFSYTGLTPKQCEVLIKKHHVYLLKNGRISMSGINTKNVAYLARAIDDVVRNVH